MSNQLFIEMVLWYDMINLPLHVSALSESPKDVIPASVNNGSE